MQIATASQIEASHHSLGLEFSECQVRACSWGTCSMSRVPFAVTGAQNLMKTCSISRGTSPRRRADVLPICVKELLLIAGRRIVSLVTIILRQRPVLLHK